MAKTEVTKIKLYDVRKDIRGKKPARLVPIQAIRVGKKVYVPFETLPDWRKRRIRATPKSAIAFAIADSEKDLKWIDADRKRYVVTLASVTALRRSVCGL